MSVLHPQLSCGTFARIGLPAARITGTSPYGSYQAAVTLNGHGTTPTYSAFGPRKTTTSRRPRPGFVARAGVDPGADATINELQEALEGAIDSEEYDLAASLRDRLVRKRQDARAVVEEANERFYNAFRNGDYAAMSRIWGTGEHVQCIHPMAECIAGREDVLKSWQLILSGGRLSITLEDVRVYATDTTGYVTAVEVVDAEDSKGRIVATNVFERQGDEFKIVLHQGGVC